MPKVNSMSSLEFAAAVNDDDPPWRDHARAEARAGRICLVCLGLGVVRYDVPYTHEWFGKVFPCVCRNDINA